MSVDSVYSCSLNLNEAIDWQRSNASKIKSWIEKEQEWIDANHCDFWNSYLSNTFDLRTANDFGLSVWAIILNENLFGVTPASPVGYLAWGYGVDRKNYNNGNYGTNSDSGYNFSVSEKRYMLLLKAFIIHMSGNVHGIGVIGINESLQRIFGINKIYCIDNRDMTFTYKVVDGAFLSIATELKSRDLLPRPAGINTIISYTANAKPFGFTSTHYAFNSNFYDGVEI
jgi:hypothetical protein